MLGSATGYFMVVPASQIVERTERGDEMFAVMAERHADQVRTVGLLERLGVDGQAAAPSGEAQRLVERLRDRPGTTRGVGEGGVRGLGRRVVHRSKRHTGVDAL